MGVEWSRALLGTSPMIQEKRVRFLLWDIGYQITFEEWRMRWVSKRDYKSSNVTIFASSTPMPENRPIPFGGEGSATYRAYFGKSKI